MTEPIITVVVTASREGQLVHRALRSVERAQTRARAAGLHVEGLVVADRVDGRTAVYLTDERWSNFRLIDTDFGDPGLARNTGVDHARADFVAFLDADDLMASDWLVRAHKHLPFVEPMTALHPQINVAFGDEVVIAQHYSSNSPGLDPYELAERNLWRTNFLVRRSVLQAVPFEEATAHDAFHEDWHWSCAFLAAGGQYVVVPETVGFYRRRAGSLMGLRAEALFLPSTLFSRTSAQNPTPSKRKGFTGPTIRSTTGKLRAQTEIVGRRLVLRYPVLVPIARMGRAAIRRLDARSVDASIQEWLRDALVDIHEVEPALYPDRRIAGAPRYYGRGNQTFARAIRELISQTPQDTTHALLVPWIKRGGADLEVLNYARALAELGHRTIVIGTESTTSPWAHRLPESVRFIDLGRVGRSLDRSQLQQLLAVFLVQSRIPKIHGLNSRLFFEAMSRFQASIAAGADVYLSVFCEDVEPSGQRVGYVTREIPALLPVLTGVFADNDRILRWIGEVYGMAPERLHVHYQPYDDHHPVAIGDRSDRTLHVLWAGRLDRQKRPDLLRDIAVRCSSLPIRFFVYGYGLLDHFGSRSMFDLPNVEFRGPYDSFDDLPLEEFDVYLHTAQWEGLPNILLEATGAGLPIVTSAVGGIPELIDSTTGILIDPFDDVERYVAALEQLLDDAALRRSLAERANARLRDQHSWSRFLDALCSSANYVGDSAR